MHVRAFVWESDNPGFVLTFHLVTGRICLFPVAHIRLEPEGSVYTSHLIMGFHAIFLSFLWGPGNLNSGFHVYTASTLLMELSPRHSPFQFLIII